MKVLSKIKLFNYDPKVHYIMFSFKPCVKGNNVLDLDSMFKTIPENIRNLVEHRKFLERYSKVDVRRSNIINNNIRLHNESRRKKIFETPEATNLISYLEKYLNNINIVKLTIQLQHIPLKSLPPLSIISKYFKEYFLF